MKDVDNLKDISTKLYSVRFNKITTPTLGQTLPIMQNSIANQEKTSPKLMLLWFRLNWGGIYDPTVGRSFTRLGVVDFFSHSVGTIIVSLSIASLFESTILSCKNVIFHILHDLFRVPPYTLNLSNAALSFSTKSN